MDESSVQSANPRVNVERRLSRRYFLTLSGAGAASLAVLGMTGCGIVRGSSTLRLSHEWQGLNDKGQGDFHAVLAKRFADRVSERTDGRVTIKIYPDHSLTDEANEQYVSMIDDTSDMSVDISIFPLLHASNAVPLFRITALPALIRTHEQAQRWPEEEIGQRVEEIAQNHGMKILTWVWTPLGLGTRSGDPVVSPQDVEPGTMWKGDTRGNEWLLKQHGGLGAQGVNIVRPYMNEVYSELQEGLLDGLTVRTGSFSYYRLYEQLETYTSPTQNALTFVAEPLVIGMDQFESLSEDQRQILKEVGNELQEYAYAASKKRDQRIEEEFEEAGVNVEHVDDTAFGEWREIAKPSWYSWADSVEGGRELVDLAREVPESQLDT